MRTAMQSLQSMVDVNTVVGDAVHSGDGTVIVPVSAVSFGFCAGGGEYGVVRTGQNGSGVVPFGGGSGAGVSVRPVAFLVAQRGTVRLLPVDRRASFDRLLDLAPELLDKLTAAMGRGVPRGGPNGALGAEEPEPAAEPAAE